MVEPGVTIAAVLTAFIVEEGIDRLESYRHVRTRFSTFKIASDDLCGALERFECENPDMNGVQTAKLAHLKGIAEQSRRLVAITACLRKRDKVRIMLFGGRYEKILDQSHQSLSEGIPSMILGDDIDNNSSTKDSSRSAPRRPSEGTQQLHLRTVSSLSEEDEDTPDLINASFDSSDSSDSFNSPSSTIDTMSRRAVCDLVVELLWGGKSTNIDVKLAEMVVGEFAGPNEKANRSWCAITEGYRAIILDPKIQGGADVRKNESESHRCWDRAIAMGLEEKADAGCFHAQFLAGWRLFFNSPQGNLAQLDDRGYSKSYYFFCKASSKGHPKAQHLVGYMCQEGIGVPSKCIYQAMVCYHKSAALGCACARYSRALRHSRDKDFRSAFLLMKLAADSGHAEAQWSVSKMFCQGEGTDIDIEQGRLYAIFAAEQGHRCAEKAVKDGELSFDTKMWI